MLMFQYCVLHMQTIISKCHKHNTANPNVQSSCISKNVTPLHIAASAGHLACLQLLVQLGGDIMAKDIEQLTPVDYARVSGQNPCLNYLNDVLGIILLFMHYMS